MTPEAEIVSEELVPYGQHHVGRDHKGLRIQQTSPDSAGVPDIRLLLLAVLPPKLLQMLRGTLRRRKQAFTRVNKAQRRAQKLLDQINEDTRDS